MKEKIKAWLNKPYTRKDVVKCNVFIMIIYVIIIGIYCIWAFSETIKEKFNWVYDQIRSIKEHMKVNKIA